MNLLSLLFKDNELEKKYRKDRLPLDLIFLRMVAGLGLAFQILFDIKDNTSINSLNPVAKEIRLFIVTPVFLICLLLLVFSKRVKREPIAFLLVSLTLSITLLFSQLLFGALSKTEVGYVAQGMTIGLFTIFIFSGIRFANLLGFIPVTIMVYCYVLFVEMLIPMDQKVNLMVDFFISIVLAGASAFFIEYKGRVLFVNQTNLIELSGKLTKENVLKNTMLSVVGHDIRGPMNRLKGILSLVNSKAMSIEETTTLLQQLEKEFDEADEMTHRLLLWVKSQFNGIVIKKGTFPISKLVEKNFSLMKKNAGEKGIQLKEDFPASLQIKGDEEVINIVLRNVISNAIKFCRAGDSITLSAQAINEGHQIFVRDTGSGFDTSLLIEREKSTQFSQGTGNEKGFGLGLKICSDLMEMHGSKLQINSEIGKGTEVSFVLLDT